MSDEHFDETSRKESPFEDDDHITFGTSGNVADFVSQVAEGLPPELLAEATRKGKEVAESTDIFDSTDCERCGMMGAIGVQIAFATDVVTKELHHTEGDLAVLKLCGPCTMVVTARAHEEHVQKKHDISRRN